MWMKAEKKKCISADVWQDLEPGNRVKLFFDDKKRVVMAALDDKEFIEKTLANNAAGRQQFYTALEEMGLPYYPTQTNFIYIDLQQDAEEVFQAMLRKGVIIRPLTSQGAPQAVRITIGLPEENARTIEAMREVLGR